MFSTFTTQNIFDESRIYLFTTQSILSLGAIFAWWGHGVVRVLHHTKAFNIGCYPSGQDSLSIAPLHHTKAFGIGCCSVSFVPLRHSLS